MWRQFVPCIVWLAFALHAWLIRSSPVYRNYCAALSGQQPLLQISWLSDVQQQQQSEQLPLLSDLQSQLSHLRSTQQSDEVHLQSAFIVEHLFLNLNKKIECWFVIYLYSCKPCWFLFEKMTFSEKFKFKSEVVVLARFVSSVKCQNVVWSLSLWRLNIYTRASWMQNF